MHSKRYSTLNAASLPIVKLRKIVFWLNFDWFDKDSIDFLYKLSFWQLLLHCSMVKLALLLSASKYTCKHTHLQRDKHTRIMLVNRKRRFWEGVLFLTGIRAYWAALHVVYQKEQENGNVINTLFSSSLLVSSPFCQLSISPQRNYFFPYDNIIFLFCSSLNSAL